MWRFVFYSPSFKVITEERTMCWNRSALATSPLTQTEVEEEEQCTQDFPAGARTPQSFSSLQWLHGYTRFTQPAQRQGIYIRSSTDARTALTPATTHARLPATYLLTPTCMHDLSGRAHSAPHYKHYTTSSNRLTGSPLLPLSWTRPHTGLRLEPRHTYAAHIRAPMRHPHTHGLLPTLCN